MPFYFSSSLLPPVILFLFPPPPPPPPPPSPPLPMAARGAINRPWVTAQFFLGIVEVEKIQMLDTYVLVKLCHGLVIGSL